MHEAGTLENLENIVLICRMKLLHFVGHITHSYEANSTIHTKKLFVVDESLFFLYFFFEQQSLD